MKKVENKGKLSLNKKFIANLNKDQMLAIKGGLDNADAADAPAKTWFISRCFTSNTNRTCKDNTCCES